MTVHTNADNVGTFTGRRAATLTTRYLGGEGAAKATLARLRRAAATSPGDDAAVWFDVFDGFPEHLVGKRDSPNTYELATHLALSLFAVHQQSKDRAMHVPNTFQKDSPRTGLGHAVRRLANPSDSEQRTTPVMRRFLALNTADEFSEISHHLRGLIQQFRAESLPLDYGQLASDLCALQYPESASRVRLRWAREVHHSEQTSGDAPVAADRLSSAT